MNTNAFSKVFASALIAAASVSAFSQPSKLVIEKPSASVPSAQESIQPPAVEKSNTKRPLSPRERMMQEAQQKWEKEGVAEALVGPGGEIQHAYGYTRPTIQCAPLHVCTIKLIPGESITSVGLGDTVRWHVQKTLAGDIPVLLIKPTQSGIATNLVVTTDAGRIYYMHIVATPKDYAPMVSFYDPEAQLRVQTAEARELERVKKKLEAAERQLQAEREAAEKRAAEHRARTVVAEIPAAEFDPIKLDFSYTCKANSRAAELFVPSRVFNNGKHTFVQMKDGIGANDMPGIFRRESGGGYALINARRSGNYFVVDGVPSQIVLAADVGNSARLVECNRVESSGFFRRSSFEFDGGN